MFLYWFIFAILTYLTLININNKEILANKKWNILWKLVFIFLILIIGLRHEVGGDWYPYLALVESADNKDFFEVITPIEPAFNLLNWIASYLGLGVYFVNFIFAVIFTWGLINFCRNQNNSWLAMTQLCKLKYSLGS